MFTCLAPGKGQHQHVTVEEAKLCWGLIKPPAPVIPVYHDPKDRPGSMTPRQRRYLKDLGASELDLHHEGFELSINQASHLIDTLKKGPAVTTPTHEHQPPAPPVEDSRITMLKALIGVVPPGYYAVHPIDSENEEDYTFFRLSIPKSGVYKGCTKVQTQHSDDLIDRVYIWPSGRWTVKSNAVLDDLLLLVTDHHTAARKYAEKIGRCMRCNKALTDDRSRHYGIGPDCEQVWTWVIPTVDEELGYHYH